MNVIFMGTPEFSVPCLKTLLEMPEVNVVCVVTQPDKPRGRGKNILPSPVKIFAEKNGLKIFQPAKIKLPESVEVLKKFSPDLIVVVAFGQILSKEVLQIPKKFGCVNVHASLLPKYRGAAPMQACLLHNEKETGVTTMQMDEGLDTGDILEKAIVPLTNETTLEELHDALSITGAKLLKQTILNLLAGKISPIKQDDTGERSSYAPILKKQDGQINFNRSAQEIHNQIRAYCVAPGAFALADDGKIYKFFKTKIACENFLPEKMPGEIFLSEAQQRMFVKASDAWLEILEWQAPNKKRMAMKIFLNGNKILPKKFFSE